MTRLVAVFDHVVLRVMPKTTKKGAILLSDGAAEDSDWCEVTSVGPDAKVFTLGDLVLRPTGLYEWHDEDNDETYIIVKDTDIVAFREDE